VFLQEVKVQEGSKATSEVNCFWRKRPRLILARRLLSHRHQRGSRLKRGALAPFREATILKSSAQCRCTERERQIVSAIAMGYTNKDIAREFSLSEDGVERYLVKLFDELGVVNRFELVIHAIGHGLLDRYVRTP
jgi:DNA-binding NarL/FixJ family response regulator